MNMFLVTITKVSIKEVRTSSFLLRAEDRVTLNKMIEKRITELGYIYTIESIDYTDVDILLEYLE